MSSTSFVIWYLLFMVPTYLLPALGSNSVLAAAATGGLTVGPFMLHLLCLVALTTLAGLRGARMEAPSLWVFAALAGVFDLVPILSSIPLVPTVFHVIALAKGGSAAPTDLAEVSPGSTQLEVRDEEVVEIVATQSRWVLFYEFVASPLATYLFIRFAVATSDAKFGRFMEQGVWPLLAIVLVWNAASAAYFFRKLVLFVSDQRVAGQLFTSKKASRSKAVSLNFEKDSTLTVSQPFKQGIFRLHELTLSYIDSQGVPRQACLPWVSNGPEVAAAFERAKRQHKDLYARNLMREAMSQDKASNAPEGVNAPSPT